MDPNQHLNNTAEEKSSGKRKKRRCDGFKIFLGAMSLSFICKALGGVIMKTSITQIERRFDIPSSTAGIIDGGFEIGNLLVIVFVSYYGSKVHRPKVIGIGTFIMGVGSIMTALPHFFMGYYKYSTDAHINLSENSTLTCLVNQTLSLTGTQPEITEEGCEKESSYMWIYVLMGNMLRGIGETPIVPLGISYIDDFAKEGHSSVYIGGLQAISMIGPIIGFVMGSVFAKMYVDIGYVDLSSIRITPTDSRWVGAWWLSFLMSGLLSIISSIPFFFLHKNPYKSKKERKVSASLHVLKTNEERTQTANLTNHEKKTTINTDGLFQSLKILLTNHLYVIYLILTLLQISGFIGVFTYAFKYTEQQYGQSASQANILLGLITLPAVATGMFSGGYIIKKLKLTLIGIAKFSFFTYFMSVLFFLLKFGLLCENKSIAGLTLAYDGINPVASHIDVPHSYCNSDCNCDEDQWEPICGDNGITYMSPCLAGCTSSSGQKKSIVFHNCTCIEGSNFQNTNYSARLGECPRDDNCKKKYYFDLTAQVISSVCTALGSASFVMLLVKNVPPELKSLAMGCHSLTIRTLGGILAPVYFGALIDKTCLKWSINSCGEQGTCRVYNSVLFGYVYLGLIILLNVLALILYIVLIYAMKKKYEGKDTKASEDREKITEEPNLEPLNNNGCVVPSGVVKETHN
ncbi:solute carrier organic anion transporter family member 1B3, transcript variant X2 [Ictidomys tridecemlineatus]|uniref:Solute carrier organic anion transporter family member n=1 Tax=Ictidomys tridecemlineatus TaxID=43179 RepID=A0A287D487_ICTTR|nr:solute carrier organic anion transporter family member 1B3 [Ictidomys tridecemlineatus]XP_021584506.1 solute carrier organic anion transporter family member 1B3 [Ictidomys tridecemlineatus]XP_021584507.1 solute carrier organic anion transporter family member 1B3 [Ictidomys tridecemlineatus]XP_040136873.1 solute carrier organic anion transporter family member 1B3 [Ictidomys tridecemlineatus]KAG3292293.1 solute carrier organic anion transporter family member 1B3, transcript variant X1 [Ictidom